MDLTFENIREALNHNQPKGNDMSNATTLRNTSLRSVNPFLRQKEKSMQAVPFNTTRRGATTISAPTQILALNWAEGQRQIQVVCTDGNIRKCNVDRLPNLNVARNLWDKLVKAQKGEDVIHFMAAGGFSPDRWFYTIEAAE